MLLTILLLIFTVVVAPLICLNFGYTPNDLQYDILGQMAVPIGVVIAYCFIVGELSRNNSQVDKLWSIVPIYYVWHMTLLAPELSERMVLMAVLVTVWGARLTFNFARRGAYTWRFWAGEEDYRWEELRKRPGFDNKLIWGLFNLFFISAYQNVLIFFFYRSNFGNAFRSSESGIEHNRLRFSCPHAACCGNRIHCRSATI